MPAVQVQTTATQLLAANTSAQLRTRVLIENLGPNAIYVGYDNTVTTATGEQVAATSGVLELRGNINGTLFAVAATANQVSPADTRVIAEQAGT